MSSREQWERHGDWLVDPETGEAEEIIPPRPEFVIDSDAAADWVMQKRMECEAELTALEAQSRAISENIRRLARRQEGRLNFLSYRFNSELQKYASKRLEGTSLRTLTLPHGKIALRRSIGSIQVIDPEKALAWAKLNAPDAVKVKITESVLLTPLKEISGNLPADCFEVRPAGQDTLHLETGV